MKLAVRGALWQCTRALFLRQIASPLWASSSRIRNIESTNPPASSGKFGLDYTLSPSFHVHGCRDRPASTTATRGQYGIVGLSHWGGVKGSLLGDLEVKGGWLYLSTKPQSRAALVCPPFWPLGPTPYPVRHYVNTALRLLLAWTIFALGIWVGRYGYRQPPGREEAKGS